MIEVTSSPKKRKAIQSTRFLLILACGDETDYYTAPLDCESVQRFKEEWKNAADHGLERFPEAGISVFAHAIANRLSGAHSSHFFGNLIYGVNGEYPYCDPGVEFDYSVDAAKIISDEELGNWILADMPSGPLSHGTTYEVFWLDAHLH